MNEGQFYQSKRITLVSNQPKLFAGSGLEDLAIEQIGVFAKDGRGRFKGTRTPTHVAGRKFKLALGMPQKYDSRTKRAQLPSWPHQTVEFGAREIISFTGTKAKPFTKEDIVALGYDGVSLTKGLQVLKGKNVKVHVHLTGAPISKLVPTIGWLHRELFIDTSCVVDTEPGAYQSQQLIQQKIIAAWNDQKFGNQQLSDFVQVKAISSCDVPPAGLVPSTIYTVAIVDAGQDRDLGTVQAQYPGFGVKRISRADLLSTYSLIKATAGVPTAVSLSQIPVLPNCTTCPGGYTLQAAANVYTVSVSSTETAGALTGQLSLVLLSANDLEKVYQYVMPLATTTAAFTALAVAANADAQVVFVGAQTSLCVPPAAQTFAWTVGGTTSQAPKNYSITLRDTVCGTDRLVELQTIYGPNVAIGVVGACSRSYTLTVYSDNVPDENCVVEQYLFKAPDAYQGSYWVDTTSTVTTNGCVCGVIFEGARYVTPVTNTTYPFVGYDNRDFDPVHIVASSYSHDYLGTVCSSDQAFPFTKLQSADYPIGYGRDVIPNELDSLHTFNKGPYDFHPVIRELFGSKFNAKPDAYYDEYELKLARSQTRIGFSEIGSETLTYRIYLPVGQGKELEAALNGLAASADLEFPEVVL